MRTWLPAALRDVVVAASVLVLVGVFLVQPFRVEGQSMEPLLAPGERILVSKLAYRTDEVRRHDVVVLRAPDGRTLVKRVIGLPGELVEVVAGRVLVDGRDVVEPYVAAARRSDESLPAHRLGADEYFVLGDNRAASLDSRAFGPVVRERIRGKAVWIYWPPELVGPVPDTAARRAR
jgi:signal peptidase I